MSGLLTPTSFIGLDIGVYPHTTEDGPKHQTVTAPIGAVCLVQAVPEIGVYPHTTEDGPKHQTVTAPIGAVCLVQAVPEIAVAKEE